MQSGSFAPGDLALWHSGSSCFSWPPDGTRQPGSTGFKTLTPTENVPVFIIAMLDRHGSIVLVRNKLWWCPLSALRGEPSGSR